jgi:hypothetical protein
MNDKQDKSAVSVRGMEFAVAGLIFAFGALVVYDSVRLGSNWAEDGPQAGYFPFYVGLILCIASVANFVRALLDKALRAESFVTVVQIKLVLAVLVPTAIYAILIQPLGIYVASVIFIAWFMRVLGKYSWLKLVLVSVGVTVAFFMMFEVWFKVPLPKGPLELALGLA